MYSQMRMSTTTEVEKPAKKINFSDMPCTVIDYKHALKSKGYNEKSYQSFDEVINKHFDIVPVVPVSRWSLRAGLLGYKIGMTHLYDQWGSHKPCTVIQIDRC